MKKLVLVLLVMMASFAAVWYFVSPLSFTWTRLDWGLGFILLILWRIEQRLEKIHDVLFDASYSLNREIERRNPLAGIDDVDALRIRRGMQ